MTSAAKADETNGTGESDEAENARRRDAASGERGKRGSAEDGLNGSIIAVCGVRN